MYLKTMNCSFSTLLLYSEQYNKNDSDKNSTDNKPRKSTDVQKDNKGGREGSSKDDTAKDAGTDEDMDDYDDEEEEDHKLPLLGLSCFAYLTIAEEIEVERLPSVYR